MEGKPLPNALPKAESMLKLQPDGKFVKGNFRPIYVERDHALTLVEGELPRDLSGQFMRIGPNPRFDTSGYFYHPFDGDGMVHSVDFSNPERGPLYQNRWIKTKRMKKAEERGFDVFGFGEISSGVFENQHYLQDEEDGGGLGAANTNVIQHSGRAYALFEADMPYEFTTQLETIGKATFDGQLKHNVAAHPKVDARTNEFILFGYDLASPKPHVGLSVVNKEGKMTSSLNVTMPAPRMLHDMVITENYNILFDPILQFEPMRVAQGEIPWVHHTEVPARFFIIPRHATSEEEGRWINVSSCGLFHFANAWEEDGKIRIFGCRSENMDMNNFDSVPNTKMHEWVISLSSWICESERTLSDHLCDFPQVDQMRQGYKTRYLYAVEFDPMMKQTFPLFKAVLKFDVETGQVSRHVSKKSFSEAVFAPSANRDHGNSAEEDTGYVIAFAHDEEKNQSECYILDAKSMEVTCRLSIPQRVPYGFHASFVHPPEMLSKL